MALAAATAETWGISGPAFLPAYLLIAAAVGVGGLQARRALADPGATGPVSDLTARPHDVAYLAGGAELAVWSALCAMHLRGAITAADGRVQATGRLEPGADALEAAIHATAGSAATHRRLVFHRSVQAALSTIEDRLVTDRFLLPDERRLRIRRVGLWMLVVAGIGLVRVLAEVAEARPVGLLVPALLLVTAVALVQLTRAPRRSRPGDGVLAALRAEHRALAPERGPERHVHDPSAAALGIGLFGTSALLAAAPGLVREIAPRAAEDEADPAGLAVNGGGDGGGSGGGNGG